MVYSLRQPGQLGNQFKSLCEKIHPTYQNFYTGNNPAAGTKSIGLPADAQAARVLQPNLDNFIMTGQLCVFYRDLQKACTATQTATNHTGWPLWLIPRFSAP